MHEALDYPATTCRVLHSVLRGRRTQATELSARDATNLTSAVRTQLAKINIHQIGGRTRPARPSVLLLTRHQSPTSSVRTTARPARGASTHGSRAPAKRVIESTRRGVAAPLTVQFTSPPTRRFVSWREQTTYPPCCQLPTHCTLLQAHSYRSLHENHLVTLYIENNHTSSTVCRF